jgi:hypothetical protein
MPRHEPLGRPQPDELPAGNKVRLRRTADGKLVPVVPPRRTTETTESKPDPRDAPDPRSGPMRNIPPYGGGI